MLLIYKNQLLRIHFLFICRVYFVNNGSQTLDGEQDEIFKWPDLVYSIDAENNNSLIFDDLENEGNENNVNK